MSYRFHVNAKLNVHWEIELYHNMTELTLLINYAGKWTPLLNEVAIQVTHMISTRYTSKKYVVDASINFVHFSSFTLFCVAMSEKHDITVMIETNT